MGPVHRRTFAIGLLACGCAPTAQSASIAGGCRGISARRPSGFVHARGAASDDGADSVALDPDYLIGSTGRTDLDEALGKALILVREFFGVSPGVGMYDDYAKPNALTYPQSFVRDTRGTIVLGQELLKRQMSVYNDQGISVVGIMAHEFGHVFQNDHDLGERLSLPDKSVKLVELHADFLAGLYMARLVGPDVRLYETGLTFQGLGDTEFGNPDHHGTPDERMAAADFGFRVGRSNPKLIPRDAIDGSIRYVRREFG